MIYTHAIVNPSRERVSRVFEGVKDNMIKSQLSQKLADENPHLYQRDVERIVSSVFEEIPMLCHKAIGLNYAVSVRFR